MVIKQSASSSSTEESNESNDELLPVATPKPVTNTTYNGGEPRYSNNFSPSKPGMTDSLFDWKPEVPARPLNLPASNTDEGIKTDNNMIGPIRTEHTFIRVSADTNESMCDYEHLSFNDNGHEHALSTKKLPTAIQTQGRENDDRNNLQHRSELSVKSCKWGVKQFTNFMRNIRSDVRPNSEPNDQSNLRKSIMPCFMKLTDDTKNSKTPLLIDLRQKEMSVGPRQRIKSDNTLGTSLTNLKKESHKIMSKLRLWPIKLPVYNCALHLPVRTNSTSFSYASKTKIREVRCPLPYIVHAQSNSTNQAEPNPVGSKPCGCKNECGELVDSRTRDILNNSLDLRLAGLIDIREGEKLEILCTYMEPRLLVRNAIGEYGLIKHSEVRILNQIHQTRKI